MAVAVSYYMNDVVALGDVVVLVVDFDGVLDDDVVVLVRFDLHVDVVIVVHWLMMLLLLMILRFVPKNLLTSETFEPNIVTTNGYFEFKKKKKNILSPKELQGKM